MNTREKEEIGVLAVALDLTQKGFKVALPFGDSRDYDLVVTEPEFKRVQVKYTESNGKIVRVRSRSHSVTAGRVTSTKTYSSATVDYIAVYDATTGKSFYIPVREVEGRAEIALRYTPCMNGQIQGVRWAYDYSEFKGG